MTDGQTAIGHYLALSLAAVAAGLAFVAASSAAPAPGVHVPTLTGRFHVGTRSIALTDRARREPEQAKEPRSLVIQLWYPTAATGRPARTSRRQWRGSSPRAMEWHPHFFRE